MNNCCIKIEKNEKQEKNKKIPGIINGLQLKRQTVNC
jgi:hypothetical protein